MRLVSKAVAIPIMFLFLMASVVPIINGYYLLDDIEPPFTSIFLDRDTGIITLVAVDYPTDSPSGVKATYYKIDGGPVHTYTGPFKLLEGRHSFEYWSIDNYENEEIPHNSANPLVDTIPPKVEIISPEVGGIYLFGKKIINFGSKTICIGKIPIEAYADDGDGYGVNIMFFRLDKFKNKSIFDSKAPYRFTLRIYHFGELTISATAVDKKGLMSEPVNMTIEVYCWGDFLLEGF